MYRLGISKKRAKLTSWSLDPETRKYAVKSIGEGISSLLSINHDCDHFLKSAIDCLLYGMLDYTINKRGDVGLFIRENSIIALQSILSSYSTYLERNGKESIL